MLPVSLLPEVPLWTSCHWAMLVPGEEVHLCILPISIVGLRKHVRPALDQVSLTMMCKVFFRKVQYYAKAYRDGHVPGERLAEQLKVYTTSSTLKSCTCTHDRVVTWQWATLKSKVNWSLFTINGFAVLHNCWHKLVSAKNIIFLNNRLRHARCTSSIIRSAHSLQTNIKIMWMALRLEEFICF